MFCIRRFTILHIYRWQYLGLESILWFRDRVVCLSKITSAWYILHLIVGWKRNAVSILGLNYGAVFFKNIRNCLNVQCSKFFRSSQHTCVQPGFPDMRQKNLNIVTGSKSQPTCEFSYLQALRTLRASWNKQTTSFFTLVVYEVSVVCPKVIVNTRQGGDPGALGAIAPFKQFESMKMAVPRCPNHTWSVRMT